MNKEIRDFLQNIVGVVEATSYETICLWKEHQDKWVQENNGYLITVGHIEDCPVCISITANRVNGKRILFVDPTSQVVDYKLIEGWLDKNLPPSARKSSGYLNKTDAMNFYNLIR